MFVTGLAYLLRSRYQAGEPGALPVVRRAALPESSTEVEQATADRAPRIGEARHRLRVVPGWSPRRSRTEGLPAICPRMPLPRSDAGLDLRAGRTPAGPGRPTGPVPVQTGTAGRALVGVRLPEGISLQEVEHVVAGGRTEPTGPRAAAPPPWPAGSGCGTPVSVSSSLCRGSVAPTAVVALSAKSLRFRQ